MVSRSACLGVETLYSWPHFKSQVWLLRDMSCGVLSDERAGLPVCRVSWSLSSLYTSLCTNTVHRFNIYNVLCAIYGSRGSSVSTVFNYELDDRVIEVRSPGEAKGFFLYSLCPERLWVPPSLLCNGYRGSFPRAGSWRWPFTPIYCRQEWVGAILPLTQASPWRVVGLH
jgi:hypothetical protein